MYVSSVVVVAPLSHNDGTPPPVEGGAIVGTGAFLAAEPLLNGVSGAFPYERRRVFFETECGDRETRL